MQKYFTIEVFPSPKFRVRSSESESSSSSSSQLWLPRSFSLKSDLEFVRKLTLLAFQ